MQPTDLQCDSPYVVTRNRVPKVDMMEMMSTTTQADEHEVGAESSISSESEDYDELNGAEYGGGDFTKQYNRQRRLHDAQHGLSETAPKRNPQQSHSDDMNIINKYVSRINLDDPTYGMVRQVDKSVDRANRATTEQVLDPRTRRILQKMINNEVVAEINGCISTGKEANVYHSVTANGAHCAIKIYKTSILVFKDRDKYVTGEFRFRKGYSRHNPRKMVKTWAEKEMRNLKRIHQAQIPSPEALFLKSHVLMMGLIGDEDGLAAPRLRDAQVFEDEYPVLYRQLLFYMRVMYHTCRLVHADLSEYNILYKEGLLYLIDVSQSVEHDHPRSLEFLRMDVKNVNDYFERVGVNVLSDRRVYDFVQSTELGMTREDAERELERLADLPEEDNDAVFQQAYIPQTLNQVFDPERDTDRIQRGEGKDLIYGHLLSMPEAKEAPSCGRSGSGSGSEDDNDNGVESDSSSEDDSQASGDEGANSPKGRKFEDKEAKRERKRQVKESARERRKDKIPKKEKKQAIKRSCKKGH